MITTSNNRNGEIIYGMLGVAVIVFTFCRYEPESDLGDFVFMEMVLMMGVLSFPTSILSVPLAFAVSFVIVGAGSLLLRQFLGTAVLYSPLMNAFVFVVWLIIFVGGYLQWFRWFAKRREIKGQSSG